MSQTPKVSVHNNLEQKRKKKKSYTWLKITLTVFIFFVLAAGGFIFYRVQNVYDNVFVNKDDSFISKLQGTIAGGLDLTTLKGESSGQINMLLLGIGGEGHDGAYLSDSMILAQIRPREKKVSLIHIPRDLYVELPKGYSPQKINAAFALGFERNKDFEEAGEWSRQVVEKISGLTIPYFAVVDFSGFKNAVDEVGGVDVVVENTFTDSSYPNEKYGYIPPVTFKKGMTHLDGKMALIFARSRHGTFPEGTDFARGARQQKVLQALKDKVKQLNIVNDTGKLNNLLTVFSEHFHTNIAPGEMLHLYSLVKNYNSENIVSLSLDQQSGIICDQTQEETGAYILTYCDGQTIKDLQKYFTDAFNPNPYYVEKPRIVVLAANSNGKEYTKAIQLLKNADFKYSFAVYRALPTDGTVFYQVNSKPLTVKSLTTDLGFTETSSLPTDLKYLTDKADIIVFTKAELK